MTDEERVQERLDGLFADHDPARLSAAEFSGAQFDGGLAWVGFPEGHGGLGLSPRLQRVVDEATVAAGVTPSYFRNPLGYGMAAPTIVEHGTDEQIARFLRPLFTGEEIWCQLFSEPGAGSDLAGLACRATRDGDEWIVSGQKVWTTLAHVSRWGLLVARSDPDAAKHAGLTYFILDMTAPGVEVKPLYQITGEAEFNEVFLTDVRVPDEHRLGGVGEGWRVSLTTLMNERVSIGGVTPPPGSGPIADAVALWKKKGHDDPARRDGLMKLWIEAEVNRLTNIRASVNRRMGVPGPEGATAKLSFAETNKAVYAYCLELLGPEGMLYDSFERVRPKMAMESGNVTKAFLRARANSIEGGTSEIMRNILGERVLGLPGDVRVDKDRPWSEIPRG